MFKNYMFLFVLLFLITGCSEIVDDEGLDDIDLVEVIRLGECGEKPQDYRYVLTPNDFEGISDERKVELKEYHKCLRSIDYFKPQDYRSDYYDSEYYDGPEYKQEDKKHFVRPHSRTLPDGRTIWVDGDGDTSVDRGIEDGGGWWRSNPSH